MIPCSLLKLATLLDASKNDLLSKWQEQVSQLPSAQSLDAPSLKDHMPMFLDELVAALRLDDSTQAQAESVEVNPQAHGIQRQKEGFDIVEVVAEYNVLRDCIHTLADHHGLILQGRTVHVLNRVIDRSIALAVRTFAARAALEVKHRREEYLAFVAHDLRTPLAAISLSVNILEAGGLPADARSVQMLKSLQRNVRQLEVLVQQVLDESLKVEAEGGVRLERRTFDLWALVEGLVHDLRPISDSSGTQLVNLVPEDLRVYADATLLRRVFQNLMTNAIKHTPGGEVVIRAKTESDRFVECQVQDNGAGIPADMLDKVFDKFETDRSDPGAVGLGLAVVKSFIEAHGGQVRVESESGRGATFRFTLPPSHPV